MIIACQELQPLLRLQDKSLKSAFWRNALRQTRRCSDLLSENDETNQPGWGLVSILISVDAKK